MSTTLEFDSAGVLHVKGNLDAGVHQEFSRCVANMISRAEPGAIVLDFDGVELVDSSGVGMLLELGSKCGGSGRTVILENCRGPVRERLGAASFLRSLEIR